MQIYSRSFTYTTVLKNLISIRWSRQYWYIRYMHLDIVWFFLIGPTVCNCVVFLLKVLEFVHLGISAIFPGNMISEISQIYSITLIFGGKFEIPQPIFPGKKPESPKWLYYVKKTISLSLSAFLDTDIDEPEFLSNHIMCWCVYIYVYGYIHVCTYICVVLYMYFYTNIHVYIHTYM